MIIEWRHHLESSVSPLFVLQFLLSLKWLHVSTPQEDQFSHKEGGRERRMLHID